MTLKAEVELDDSPVVANCRMNRERELRGGNGYARELGFDPVEWLSARLAAGRAVAWLDLCCGTGRALAQGVEELRARHGDAAPLRVDGVDLVDAFVGGRLPRGLHLHVTPLRAFAPPAAYDLVTCVHGLHYVGDKLEAVASACRWLAPDGRFVASLDPRNLRLDGRPGARAVLAAWRARGVRWDARRGLLSTDGQRALELPFRFLGADDAAGPNATGQPAVDSHYARTPA